MVRILFLLMALLLMACSSLERSPENATSMKPAVPLYPKTKSYNGQNAPIIQNVSPASPAAEVGLKPGDQITHINNIPLFTASDLEIALKKAPEKSQLTYLRKAKRTVASVHLSKSKPRLGAEFEPVGIAFSRHTSPMIGIMHLKELTVFAQASATDRNQLRLNFIIESGKRQMGVPVSLRIFESGDKEPLATHKETIDALGSSPVVFSKTIPRKNKDIKLPLKVSLGIAKNNFLFEFQ